MALIHEHDHDEDMGIEGPGCLDLPEEIQENHYSMRMNSIIPGHRSSSLPGVHTIEEESGEEDETEEEGGEDEDEEDQTGEEGKGEENSTEVVEEESETKI